LRTNTRTLGAILWAIGLLGVIALGSTSAFAASGGASVPGPEPAPAPAGTYVNPFSTGSWTVSRTDMGVDYMPMQREPVLAIGRARILGSSMKSGWPGGAFLWYRLLNGDHAGNVIYVAEHLTKLAPAGTVVRAGQEVATALPGYPWTEWGWATPSGSPRAYPCYRDGMATNSGKEMARFLQSLGAKPLSKLQPGPNRPSGKLC
jgi:hypothetical protein